MITPKHLTIDAMAEYTETHLRQGCLSSYKVHYFVHRSPPSLFLHVLYIMESCLHVVFHLLVSLLGCHQLVFQPIHLFLQLLHRPLCILCSALCLLVFGTDNPQLLRECLLLLARLLLAHLKALQVVSDCSQLLLQFDRFALAGFSS